jgi:hypothetical protein
VREVNLAFASSPQKDWFKSQFCYLSARWPHGTHAFWFHGLRDKNLYLSDQEIPVDMLVNGMGHLHFKSTSWARKRVMGKALGLSPGDGRSTWCCCKLSFPLLSFLHPARRGLVPLLP